jgi:hypothetical protein
MTAIRGQRPHRGKTVTTAEFRRLWFDASLTQTDIAAALGIGVRALWQRARHRGMPPRTGITNAVCTLDAEAEAMWRACVRGEDIAAAYGVSVAAVHKHAHRKGIQRSRPVTRWLPAISIADYRAVQFAEAMAREAAVTRAAMRDSEMVDRIGARWAA